MNGIEIFGYGYEYDAKHIGGPFDGLNDSIVSFKSTPPLTAFYILDDDEKDYYEGDKLLGKKLLNKWKKVAEQSRVAVYKIEGDPEEYNDDDVINYHFQGVMLYSQYKEKYL